jgi:hypothetical protein
VSLAAFTATLRRCRTGVSRGWSLARQTALIDSRTGVSGACTSSEPCCDSPGMAADALTAAQRLQTATFENYLAARGRPGGNFANALVAVAVYGPVDIAVARSGVLDRPPTDKRGRARYVRRMADCGTG